MKLPRLWIVADFDKSFSENKNLPENVEFLNCHNTELSTVWSVINRGPFGLIAEEYREGIFRGFFTLNQNVCREALQVMGNVLKTKFTIQ